MPTPDDWHDRNKEILDGESARSRQYFFHTHTDACKPRCVLDDIRAAGGLTWVPEPEEFKRVPLNHIPDGNDGCHHCDRSWSAHTLTERVLR